MAETLFIRLQAEQISWRVDQAGGASGENDIDEAARHARGRQVIVLVPITDVPLFTVKLPTRNRARMAQAVPYVLEDQLSEDVDTLHFALGKPDSEGKVTVAVVGRERMDHWLVQLQDAGIQPQQIIPDVLALPLQTGTWSGLLEPGQLLLRTGSQQGTAMDSSDLSWLLPLALDEAGEPLPSQLQLLDCDPLAPSIPPTELSVEHEQCGGTPLHHLCEGYDRSQVIDLLQGDFSPGEQGHRLWRIWRVAAALAAVWVLVSLLGTALENHQLAEHELAYRQDITAVYRDTFPQETAIVDPRIQMQKKLDALHQGGGSRNAEFLRLLSLAGKPLTSDRSIKLNTVRYKQNRLDLELDLPTIQTLDKLKATLEQNGLQVTIRNARSREGKVEGRLEIRANSG